MYTALSLYEIIKSHHTHKNSLYKQGKLGRTVIDTIGTAVSGFLVLLFTSISDCTSTGLYSQTPTLLHISTKNQLPETFIYHTTAKYVPAANITLKYHKYATCPNYLMCIPRGSIPMYMPHTKLLPLMM